MTVTIEFLSKLKKWLCLQTVILRMTTFIRYSRGINKNAHSTVYTVHAFQNNFFWEIMTINMSKEKKKAFKETDSHSVIYLVIWSHLFSKIYSFRIQSFSVYTFINLMEGIKQLWLDPHFLTKQFPI